MENRKILSAVFGITQSIIGIASAVLAVLLFCNSFEVQTIFTAPPELLPVYLLILCLFSIFSVISGFFLIREWWRRV
ncbi:MAG: hypothetical protein CW691_08680 [Candidatus Bathyarchaeum sp.]|nr:MAG: hypothetical protein CW691_08680 [Candidatus Bathyarchaeum sp.]